ncbi:MAG: YraN family protein [Gammaproteobacteria bacterium]|nr:YraN family protein [Gammaproteobacteria bacterium]MDH5659993.1 YraN family protein [Gammaproteobacteria bacterium]
MTTTREQGQYTENLACQYLENKGFKLLERNFHCRFGEIDLIMQQDNAIVFVEVRYRRSNNFGSGAESVTVNKQSKLIKTASIYLQQHAKLNKYPARFDIISITGSIETNNIENIDFDWIENAFGA